MLLRVRSAKLFSSFSKQKVIIAQSFLIAVAIIGTVRGILLSAESTANINDQHLAVASWVNEHTTVKDIIAAHDVGALGYKTQRQVIDLTGLMSPEIFPLPLSDNGIQ